MESVRISFLGDISLNNRYNNLYENGKNPFSETFDELKSSDMVFGNLECLSTGDKGENILKKPRLMTEQQTLNFLKNIPLTVATFAHNHVYDGLIDGYLKTKEILTINNIEYFGVGLNPQSARFPFFKSIHGTDFAFLNYVTKDTNPKIPENSDLTPNFFDIDIAKSDIQQSHNSAKFVIVLLHWGGRVENGMFPDWEQPKIAKELIDCGADLIIGHHSHTIQPFEKYKGKYIFYSLGNFCFDDIIFENKLYKRLSIQNKESIIIHVDFINSGYSISLKTYKNKQLHLTYSELVKIKLYIRILYFKLLKNAYPLWLVYFCKLKIINPILFFIFREDDTFVNKLKRIYIKVLKR
jgi:hypothetical protein